VVEKRPVKSKCYVSLKKFPHHISALFAVTSARHERIVVFLVFARIHFL